MIVTEHLVSQAVHPHPHPQTLFMLIHWVHFPSILERFFLFVFLSNNNHTRMLTETQEVTKLNLLIKSYRTKKAKMRPRIWFVCARITDLVFVMITCGCTWRRARWTDDYGIFCKSLMEIFISDKQETWRSRGVTCSTCPWTLINCCRDSRLIDS